MPPAIFQSNEIVSDIKDWWLSTGYPRNVPETYIHIVFLDHLMDTNQAVRHSILFFSCVVCLCYFRVFIGLYLNTPRYRFGYSIHIPKAKEYRYFHGKLGCEVHLLRPPLISHQVSSSCGLVGKIYWLLFEIIQECFMTKMNSQKSLNELHRNKGCLKR